VTEIPTPVLSGRRTLGFLLHDAARLMRRRFVQLAREAALPLNFSEANVLLHVAHEEGINQVTLATHLDIEPIALVRLLDRLQDAGLVERRACPCDRRVRKIWLTGAAAPMLRRIRAITATVREEALAGFTESERAALAEALLRLRVNLATPEAGPAEIMPSETETCTTEMAIP
jgi:MarR family transcriptional regulator, transcriptional regulator for hemolysin